MKPTRQSLLMATLFENAPSIIFLTSLSIFDDLRLAGWCGTLAASAVGAAYVARKLEPHPILLGINLFMLGITPAIEVLHLLDRGGFADHLIAHAETCVLGTIFLTGCVMTVTARNRFLGIDIDDEKSVLRYAFILLGVSAATIVWSAFINAERIVEIGLPLLMLFGVRQFLAARLSDRYAKSSHHEHLLIAGASSPDGGPNATL